MNLLLVILATQRNIVYALSRRFSRQFFSRRSSTRGLFCGLFRTHHTAQNDKPTRNGKRESKERGRTAVLTGGALQRAGDTKKERGRAAVLTCGALQMAEDTPKGRGVQEEGFC